MNPEAFNQMTFTCITLLTAKNGNCFSACSSDAGNVKLNLVR